MDDFQLIPSVEPKRMKKLAGDPPARQLKLLDGLDCGPGQLDLFDDNHLADQATDSKL